MAKSETQALFTDWKAEPLKAFDAYLVTAEFVERGRRPLSTVAGSPQPIREGSLRTYQAMFRKYLNWLSDHKIDLFSATARDIHTFLDAKTVDRFNRAREMKSSIRLRYLRLLERVYAHLTVQPNPASVTAYVVQTEKAAGKDNPKASLDDAEQSAFLEALPVGTDKVSGEGEKAWKVRRDRAMLVVMLGGGLKVSELTGLYLENVGRMSQDGTLPLLVKSAATHGVGQDHTTVLQPFAAQELVRWVSERREMLSAGPLLFPSSSVGKRIDATTVYKVVRKAFDQAGILSLHKGPRTLRNTFAINALKAGVPDEVIIEWMGFTDPRPLQEYKSAVKSVTTRA